MGDVLEPGEIIRPTLSADEAEELLYRLYGLKPRSVKELNSYDDRNFLFKVDSETSNSFLKGNIWSDGYVLKVTNRLDSLKPDFSEAQNLLILHLSASGLAVPEPVENLKGATWSLEPLSAKGKMHNHVVRLLKFIPGRTFYEVDPWTSTHFREAGQFVAKMDLSLKTFSHPAYESRNSIWFLSSIPSVREFISAVEDLEKRALVTEVIEAFCESVVPASSNLEKAIIHGDFNEQNILCRQKPGEEKDEFEIFSVIDFGDSQHNPVIYELGICIMYMMTRCKSISTNLAGGHVLAGYLCDRQLPIIERRLLRLCVAARYAQSLVMGAYSYAQDPGNEYLLITAKTGWETLNKFWTTSEEDLYRQWDAIILESHPKLQNYMCTSLSVS